MLGRLDRVAGIRHWRDRLQRDPPGFAETLTELGFAAWLLDLGYRFDLRHAGADVAIHLGGERPFRVEATTPRKAAWVDDLFERLDLLGRRTGFAANVEHRLETLPDPALSGRVVEDVVRSAIAALAEAAEEGVRRPVVQAHPEVELNITWTPDPDPRIRGSTSPGPTSPYWGFGYVVDAARAKAGQLPADEAGALLIGTSQLPALAWMHFLDGLDHYRPEDFPLDWTLLPPQVTVVMLCPFVARSAAPVGGRYLVNPASPFPLPPEADAFLRRLFPVPRGQGRSRRVRPRHDRESG